MKEKSKLKLKDKDKKLKDKEDKYEKKKKKKDLKLKKKKEKTKDKQPKEHKDKEKDGKYAKKKVKGGAGRSRSAKAGLFFPVGRIHRMLKDQVPRHTRVGSTCAIYIAAVLEYVVAEVLEMAGNNAKANKKRRINPRNIQLAIKGDQELNTLIKATISGGGVVPFLHKALLKKPTNPYRE